MDPDEINILARKAIRNRLARAPGAGEVSRVARQKLPDDVCSEVLEEMETICDRLRAQLRGGPTIEDDPDDDNELYPD